jgi:hypothetical protein
MKNLPGGNTLAYLSGPLVTKKTVLKQLPISILSLTLCTNKLDCFFLCFLGAILGTVEKSYSWNQGRIYSSRNSRNYLRSNRILHKILY